MREITLTLTAVEYAAIAAAASAARQSPEVWALSAVRAAQKKAEAAKALEAEEVREAAKEILLQLRNNIFLYEVDQTGQGCFGVDGKDFYTAFKRRAYGFSFRAVKKGLLALEKSGHLARYTTDWGKAIFSQNRGHPYWLAYDSAYWPARILNISAPKAEKILSSGVAIEDAPRYLEATTNAALAYIEDNGELTHHARATSARIAGYLSRFLSLEDCVRVCAFSHYHRDYAFFGGSCCGRNFFEYTIWHMLKQNMIEKVGRGYVLRRSPAAAG